jgi:hypothetical protein
MHAITKDLRENRCRASVVGFPKWWKLLGWAAGEDFSAPPSFALVDIWTWRHAAGAVRCGARWRVFFGCTGVYGVKLRDDWMKGAGS